ncbi:hypothetical protein [Stutzerimonas stutzeri]|nr:hypothetical protein [Stutzerimonas stutzeri]
MKKRTESNLWREIATKEPMGILQLAKLAKAGKGISVHFAAYKANYVA